MLLLQPGRMSRPMAAKAYDLHLRALPQAYSCGELGFMVPLAIGCGVPGPLLMLVCAHGVLGVWESTSSHTYFLHSWQNTWKWLLINRWLELLPFYPKLVNQCHHFGGAVGCLASIPDWEGSLICRTCEHSASGHKVSRGRFIAECQEPARSRPKNCLKGWEPQTNAHTQAAIGEVPLRDHTDGSMCSSSLLPCLLPLYFCLSFCEWHFHSQGNWQKELLHLLNGQS